MTSRLPSLNALRAFEAVTRLGSVTAAAQALNVTPGAISHQIKLLEADLGVPLLVRDGRGVAPTPEGRAGLAALSSAFEQLQAGVDAIRRSAVEAALTISLPPPFARSWLLPRLDHYWARAPHVDVRLETKWELADFAFGGVDLAIRFGGGFYEGLVVRRLMNERYLPVCSPDLPRGTRPLRRLEDLAQHTLLHVGDSLGNSEFPSWRMWLKAAGLEGKVDHRGGARFQLMEGALMAAREGKGVVLAAASQVKEDLARRHLICCFGEEKAPAFGYHLVCPPENLDRPLVSSFVAWLLEEASVFEMSRTVRRLQQA